MKVIYIADDGREFEDEDKCLEYEKFENKKTKKLLSEIHAFTTEGKEMKVGSGEEEYDMESMLALVMYVTFDSDEALHFFDDQQEYYGYPPIHECTICKNGDVFIYNDGDGAWISAKEMIEYYQDIITEFRERK